MTQLFDLGQIVATTALVDDLMEAVGTDEPMLAMPLLLISLFVFLLLHAAPGDPADILIPDQATEQDIKEARQRWGLERVILQPQPSQPQLLGMVVQASPAELIQARGGANPWPMADGEAIGGASGRRVHVRFADSLYTPGRRVYRVEVGG